MDPVQGGGLVLVLCHAAALLAALVHVLIWVMESLRFSRPEVYRRFLVPDGATAAVIRPWAFNQGFYNLFLAIGTVTGLVLWASDHDAAGKALVAFGCGSMLAAAVVLIATDRHLARAAAMQGLLPLVALVALPFT
jgi:putative membrane protein